MAQDRVYYVLSQTDNEISIIMKKASDPQQKLQLPGIWHPILGFVSNHVYTHIVHTKENNRMFFDL